MRREKQRRPAPLDMLRNDENEHANPTKQIPRTLANIADVKSSENKIIGILYRYLLEQVKLQKSNAAAYQHTQWQIHKIDSKININKKLLDSLIEALIFLQAEHRGYGRYAYYGKEFVDNLTSSWFRTAYTEYSGADIPIYEYIKVVVGMPLKQCEHDTILAFYKRISNDSLLSSSVKTRLSSLSKNLISASIYSTALFATCMTFSVFRTNQEPLDPGQFFKFCFATLLSSCFLQGAHFFSSVIQYNTSKQCSSLTPKDANEKLRGTSEFFRAIVAASVINENTSALRR